LDARLEQAELLELLGELARDPGAAAELPDVELVLAAREPHRTRAPPVLARGRRELLTDHAKREELVALEAQDRLQPLDVVLAEEPVAALRALRREEPLVLEVADLRDRDVRELRLEARADRADREQALGLRGLEGRRAHLSRKVSRYLPIWSSSPS